MESAKRRLGRCSWRFSTVRSSYQETTGEETAVWKDLACAVVEISDGAISKCRHESCVKAVNKSNLKYKTPDESFMHGTTGPCDPLAAS
jgi:hypothetical protein